MAPIILPMEPTTANSKAPTTANSKRWTPPRGIRLYSIKERPERPYAVQWRVDGKRVVKTFETVTAQIEFAKTLAGDVAKVGTAAFRLDEDETREWRAFRAQIAPAPLEAVLACWTRFGPKSQETLTVNAAADRFLEQRKTLGLSPDSISHAKLHLERFRPFFGSRSMGSITADDLRSWLADLVDPDTRMPFEPRTVAHHIRTLKIFFKTALAEKWTTDNPALPLHLPKDDDGDVTVLSIQDARKLFEANVGALCVGRLAMEAFGGLRYTSGARLHPDDLKADNGGVVMPGQKHKSGKRHYVEGYPDNMWAWVKHAPAACWEINPRMYLDLKREAFERAGLKPKEPADGKRWSEQEEAQFKAMHNVLRHSFCSYHIALNKDAARTAILLTHRSPSTLYQHYMGRATEVDAKAYFSILPPA